jgi:hypothetical protein
VDVNDLTGPATDGGAGYSFVSLLDPTTLF